MKRALKSIIIDSLNKAEAEAKIKRLITTIALSNVISVCDYCANSRDETTRQMASKCPGRFGIEVNDDGKVRNPKCPRLIKLREQRKKNEKRKRYGIKDDPPPNFVSNAMAPLIGNHSKVSTAEWEALNKTLEKLDTHYNAEDELFECGVKFSNLKELSCPSRFVSTRFVNFMLRQLAVSAECKQYWIWMLYGNFKA